MRRREFLAASAGLTGAMIPVLAGAQTKPCPPGELGVSGGGAVESQCGDVSPVTDVDWVPPVGSIRDVAGQVNLLASLEPVQTTGEASGSFDGVLDAWCQTAYAKTMGAHGSLIAFGGGHSNSSVNGVYRFDIATKTWTVMKKPAGRTTPSCNGLPIQNSSSDNYMADAVWGEYWQTSAATDTHIGEVAANHTYARLLWTPPGSFGSDPAGYLYLGSTQGLPKGGSRSGRSSHYMALTPGEKMSGKWSRGVTWENALGYGPAAYDSSRKRVVVLYSPSVASSTPTAYIHTIGSTTPRAVTLQNSTRTSNQSVEAGYATLFYSPSLDVFIKPPGSDFDMWLINPSDFSCTVLNTSPIFNAVAQGSFEWVEEWQQLICIPTGGEASIKDPTVHRLVAPANPLTQAWSYQTYQLSGSGRGDPSTSHPQLNKVKYVASLDCFVYAPMVNVPTQVFRIPRYQ